MPTDLGSGLVIDGYAPAVAGYLDVPEELVRSSSAAKIYTYTPIIWNTVYLFEIRYCTH